MKEIYSKPEIVEILVADCMPICTSVQDSRSKNEELDDFTSGDDIW